MVGKRIKQLRNSLDLGQSEFGKRIGLTATTICRIEGGQRGLTKQNIKGLCREFGISEAWLIHGTGSMYEDIDRSELAAQVVGSCLASKDDFIINTFIALGQLSPEDWAAVKEFAKKLLIEDK